MVVGSDSDAMSLVASLSQDSGDGGASQPARKKPRNTMLRGWELPPAQLLNPMGKSGVGAITVEHLWNVLGKGGDKTEFFSNLHSEKPERRLVGISQLCEVMEVVCKHIIEDKALDFIVKPDLWKEVKAEAERLLPTFTGLNQKGMRRGDVSKAKNIAYYQQDVSRPSSRVLTDHAGALHKFLTDTSSKLRMFIAAMSSGGIFFVAQCHEKTARGFVQFGGGVLPAIEKAVVAGSGEVEAVDESAGLLGGS